MNEQVLEIMLWVLGAFSTGIAALARHILVIQKQKENLYLERIEDLEEEISAYHGNLQKLQKSLDSLKNSYRRLNDGPSTEDNSEP